MDFGGYDVKRVLIVDDIEEDVENLKIEFEKNDCDIFFAKNSDELNKLLQNIEKIDLVIIDLVFNNDMNGTTAIAMLEDIKSRYFVPIVIYTAHPYLFEYKLKQKLPGNMIISVSKSFPPEFDFDKVSKWLESSPTNKIAIEWFRTVQGSITRTLWQIEELDETGIVSILKSIKVHQMTDFLGEREFVNLINKILTREITKDYNLLERIKQVLSQLKSQPISNDQTQKFWRISAYDTTIKNKLPFDTGDLIKFDDGTYGIIITPICDMANDDPNEIIKVLVGYSEDTLVEEYPSFDKSETKTNLSRFKINRFHPLFYADPSSKHIIIDFAKVNSIKRNDLDKKHKEGKVERILNIESPHYENIIQRYASYHRFGIPTIPE